MQSLKKELLRIKNDEGQNGVSLYFAVVVMTILLSIGLGLSTIIINQMKIIKGTADSVIALHAADTGIELALYKLYVEGESLSFEVRDQQIGQATFSLFAYQAGSPQCPTPPNNYYCLRSIGNFKGTKRAIEASY